jgi:HSP20 family protein
LSGFFGNPSAVARRFSEDVDRLFGTNLWPEFHSEGSQGWWPAVEVLERNGHMVVRADLPGLSSDDVKVEINGGNIVIQGERKRENEESRQGFYRSERSYGSFSRQIPLPEGAKVDDARAQFTNGVLEVSVPVSENSMKGRQIPIETSR